MPATPGRPGRHLPLGADRDRGGQCIRALAASSRCADPAAGHHHAGARQCQPARHAYLVQQQDVAAGQSALLGVTNIVMALVAGLLFGNLLMPARKNL